ncbi:hypothetical protein CYLTODRAFT_431446 [Cylindrobasidium torrendii FP15055 ss-10]|uniref:GST N-terminal domain-containing protein n=1 Tax=Cylindrobasidium torrendii FP15055 ss-10 TaxID=1314674 RepID=A0A0D7B9N4_9AGAR|nr:hypothetical protein CYLTODRAFT_431446 [Cylindrobasidium torrendii FP15055 ss-10]
MATKLAALTLYDIPSKLANKAWSPNTWKTRYCLNFKGIPYQTEWIEYPDIKALYETHHIPAPRTKGDGSPDYTLPLLHDSTTGKFVPDSTAIALYLEEHYPEAPVLFPPGTKTLILAYEPAFDPLTDEIGLKFVIPRAHGILNERSAEYFRETRERAFHCKIEEIEPQGEERAQAWAKAKAEFDQIAEWYEKDQILVMGDKVSYADVALAGWIVWLKLVFGEESDEWQDIATWSDGRWAKLLETLAPYETIS